MILVFCPKSSNRITYSLGLLLETHLGIKWELSDKPEAYLRYEGPKINYGGAPQETTELYIAASGMLSERTVRTFSPELEREGSIPLLFPSSVKHCGLGFDPFSAAFYMVSRYEEYLPFQGDRLGRFEAGESLAYKKGFLGIPVVDHYALKLKAALQRVFPGLEFPERKFVFIPSIDVDVAFAYRGRGAMRTLLGSLSSLVRMDFQSLKQRFRVLAGKEKDPYDTYDLQLEWHREFGLRAWYFFLCGDYGPFDKNIAFYSPVFYRLVKRISDYAMVGLHPSYASGDHPKRLAEEIKRLSGVLNRDVRFSRQHYLRLSLPGTYQELIRNDISNDFSMGFASQPGFRAGTCTPFFFYDLDREAATNLKVYPLVIMDGTFHDYLGVGPEKALGRIKELIIEVKKVKGTFISLWHNDSLSDTGSWAGWRKIYREMLEFAVEHSMDEL
jgi:hypothetical protein